VIIEGIELSPANFVIDKALTTCGGPINPGGSCRIAVLFTRPKLANCTGTLTIMNNGAASRRWR